MSDTDIKRSYEGQGWRDEEGKRGGVKEVRSGVGLTLALTMVLGEQKNIYSHLKD